MFSVPDGRAANQPVWATTFRPSIASPFAGARVSLLTIGSPARLVAVTASGDSFLRRAFCSGVAGRVDPRVVRRAELLGQRPVVAARILAGAGA